MDESAREGMRVLGVASAVLPLTTQRPETPRFVQFQFLGLVALTDPLRLTVPAAVQDCRTAGIRIVMITGDYPKTGARSPRRLASIPPRSSRVQNSIA